MNDIVKKESQLLQSVENALKIIDLLSENGEMGISEISRALKVGKSTAFRLTSTLKSRGFVIQSASTEKYNLSTKFVRIGSSILAKYDLISIVRPYLQELSRKHGEATHLVVMEGQEIVFIDKVNSSNVSIQMHSRIGARMPAYCTGTGKLLLASNYMDSIDEYLDKTVLTKHTDNTLTDKEDIKKELARIIKNGYSEDNEETEIGLYCFAAPIKNYMNKTIAAISISGPAARMKEKKEEIVGSIRQTADNISESIGWLEY
ncbi:MAG: IclR family transcriptional regulator [Clostridiaceae bacterium]|nr:IclR family transcriptional regulator [Clostridiaceae bacterium]